jgi:hypothetical protein
VKISRSIGSSPTSPSSPSNVTVPVALVLRARDELIVAEDQRAELAADPAFGQTRRGGGHPFPERPERDDGGVASIGRHDRVEADRLTGVAEPHLQVGDTGGQPMSAQAPSTGRLRHLQAVGELADRRRREVSAPARERRQGGRIDPEDLDPRSRLRRAGLAEDRHGRDIVAERPVPADRHHRFRDGQCGAELGHAQVEPRPIRGRILVPLAKGR